MEWQKFAPNWTFRVGSAIFFITLPLLVWATELTTVYLHNNPLLKTALGEQYVFPQIFKTVSYWAGQLSFFTFPFLILSSITMEYHHKTMRQAIITGLERHQYVMGKLTIVFLLGIIATLYMNLIALVYGYLHPGSFNLQYMGLASAHFFLQIVAYMSMAAMLGFFFKRMSLSTICFFTYVIVLERVIIYVCCINLLDFPELGSILPASTFWCLLPITWLSENFELVDEIASSKSYQAGILEGGFLWLTSSIYILLFWSLSFIYIKKIDL